MTVDGYRFPSVAEAKRYGELLLRQRATEIRGLKVHPRYRLEVNGVLIAHYTPDFAYDEADGPTPWRPVVEDVKSRGTRTLLFQMKKRLMLACHGIDVQEVEA